VSRVLFASSGGAVYGEQERFPAPESHPHQPISPYGITKATGELYLSYYRAVHGIPFVALRYSNVYGPRQDPHGEAGVVAIFCERLLAGEVPTIYGDGKQTRDYVFVGDVVRANLAALATDFVGAVNIGTEHRDRREPALRASPVPHRMSAPRQVRVSQGRGAAPQRDRDRSRARKAWLAPQITLEEGLRRTVEFFRARRAS
jgi:UDP-glucose 4-epimerase